MLRTVMIGTISAQGILVARNRQFATVRIGNQLITGRLVERFAG